MFRFTKFKSLALTSDSGGHQLLQRCWVSGTAKGKSKIKPGQQLKRSKITIKRGGAASSKGAVVGGGGKKVRPEQEKLYDECLNAPTPLRFLKPRDRDREAVREKLGLISKERQREIEMMKKDKSKLGVSDSPSMMGTMGFDLISLGVVDADKIPKYELTEEDGRRLAKEYSQVLMKRHRARQAAESMLLQMKKDAIEALPEHLKVAALVPDMTPFPPNRFMATLTPPIEGYIEKVNEAARRSSGKEKLR